MSLDYFLTSNMINLLISNTSCQPKSKTNSTDPDQMQKQSDQGLPCLLFWQIHLCISVLISNICLRTEREMLEHLQYMKNFEFPNL